MQSQVHEGMIRAVFIDGNVPPHYAVFREVVRKRFPHLKASSDVMEVRKLHEENRYDVNLCSMARLYLNPGSDKWESIFGCLWDQYSPDDHTVEERG